MKHKKPILISIAILIVIVLSIPIFYIGTFLFSGAESSRENAVLVKKFINIPTSEHERLISFSQNIEQGEYGEQPTDKAGVPAEFQSFGFYRLLVEETRVRAFLYSSFDSGGEAVVDWSNPSQPTITFVEGDYADIITKVYPKEK